MSGSIQLGNESFGGGPRKTGRGESHVQRMMVQQLSLLTSTQLPLSFADKIVTLPHQ